MEPFIFILDILGTIAFAVTGAFKAIEHKADIFGILVLATVVGVGGGITRDVVFGQFPSSFSDPTYIGITIATAIVVFFLYPTLKKIQNVFLLFDAIGMGVFSVVGATVAFQLYGMEPLAIFFGGMISAIGGGIIRDVLIREIPIVFVKEVYAAASFAGVLIFILILVFADSLYFATLIGIITATSIRLVAMKYKWNLPKVE